MNRNGARAYRLETLLKTMGTTLGGKPVTRNELERLDRERLLLPDDDQAVKCVEALSSFGYGRGKSADEAALRLLAKGLGVPRVRRVLTAIGCDPLQTLLGMLGELGPDELDAIAVDWASTHPARIISSAMNRITAGTKDVPVSGRTDYAGAEISESTDDRARAVNRVVLDALANRPSDQDDIEKFIDVTRSPYGLFGPDRKHYRRVTLPFEYDEAARSLDLFQHHAQDYPTRAASAPLEELADSAVSWTAFLDQSLPYLGEREREVLAALFSPIPLAHMMTLVDISKVGDPPMPGKRGGTIRR